MATRIRKTAQVYACNSREQAQSAIKQLGDLQREHARITTELNDAIARITEAEAPRLDALRQRMDTLQAGVQTWCEANREQLCGKGKTANLITGEVAWRIRPPSVRVTGVDSVIDLLKRMTLGRFVRTKEEINKEAALGWPDERLELVGLKRQQSDTFFIEIKKEDVPETV